MKLKLSLLMRHHAFALLTAFSFAVLAAPEAQSRQSFNALVREIGLAANERQMLFVDAAVAELKAAYRAVARAQAGHQSWVAGTRAFSANFDAALVVARAGARIRLLQGPDGAVRVVIGASPARQFMLTAPTAGGGPDLERAIVQHFCRLDGCGGPVTAALPAARARTVAPPGTARLGAVVAELPAADGLSCGATDALHDKLYASACAALLGELRALAHALHGAARRGIAIEWPRIEHAGAAGVLLLNTDGDRLKIATPALAQAPELGVAMVPWLRDRLAGKVRLLAFAPPSRLVYAAR